MRVFITGGSGLIGRHLVQRLIERGDQPVILSRRADHVRRDPAMRGRTFVQGDPSTAGRWEAELDGCDAVVNLAGHNLFAERWNAQVKRKIRDSRVYSTENVVAAMAWSGDVVQLQQNNKNLVFVIPEEGGMLWSDNQMILATSSHVANAEAWIDYVYDPAHAAQITAYLRKAVSGSTVEVISDPGREPGTAIFETDRGNLDASVDSQLHEIERGLIDRLHQQS